MKYRPLLLFTVRQLYYGPQQDPLHGGFLIQDKNWDPFYSLLPAVSQVKTQFHPLGQPGSGLRLLDCFARPVWDVGLEDVNNYRLFQTAFLSITLKSDKGSAEGPAFIPWSSAYHKHRCIFKVPDTWNRFYP